MLSNALKIAALALFLTPAGGRTLRGREAIHEDPDSVGFEDGAESGRELMLEAEGTGGWDDNLSGGPLLGMGAPQLSGGAADDWTDNVDIDMGVKEPEETLIDKLLRISHESDKKKAEKLKEQEDQPSDVATTQNAEEDWNQEYLGIDKQGPVVKVDYVELPVLNIDDVINGDE